MIEKMEMEAVCADFLKFCTYVVNHHVKVSKTTWMIGRNDCFEINKLFRVKESFEKSNFQQDQYPIIHFFYYVALKYSILEINPVKRIFVLGRNYSIFQDSSWIEKYVFLTVHALCDCSYPRCKDDWVFRAEQLMEKIYMNFEKGRPCSISADEFWWLIFDTEKMAHVLEECSLIQVDVRSFSERNISLNRNAQINLLPLCEPVCRVFQIVSNEMESFWNIGLIDWVERYLHHMAPNEQEFQILKLFLPMVIETEDQSIDLEVKMRNTNVVRVIRMNLSDTLYTLHQMIQKAVCFDDGHLFEFHVGTGILKKTYTLNVAFISNEEEDVQDTTLAQLECHPGMEFDYLFDFGDMWRFDIKVLKIGKNPVEKPEIIKEVNPAPNQYAIYDEW